MRNTKCEILTPITAIFIAFIPTFILAFILYPLWKTFCPHFRNT